MSTTADKILAEIARHEEDWCFSPKDFMGLAERDALDKAFSRLSSEGVIRRIGRGVYDVPRYSRVLKNNPQPQPEPNRAGGRPAVWLADPPHRGVCGEYAQPFHPGSDENRVSVRRSHQNNEF